MALNTPLDRVWLVPQHGRGPRHSCSSVSPASRPPRRRKSSEEAVRERQQVVSLAAKRETSLLRFYVSREWLNKFNTFAEPGPITNHTFLCPHGGEGAFSVPRVWDGRADPPPVPPRTFLRRHPAQQVPLHRRPGGDPAAGRLGVPVQQVRCCGQPLPGGRPAPSRAAEEDREGAATVPSAPAADGTEAVAGASLASVSELEKTHGVGGTQVDAHRAQVQKTGLSERARIGPSHVLGVLAAGRPGQHLSPTPCLAQVALGLCCLEPSTFKSIKARTCGSLVEGLPRLRSLHRWAGRACCGQGWPDSWGRRGQGAAAALASRWTGFALSN